MLYSGDSPKPGREAGIPMERFKQLIVVHLEKILVGVILVAALSGTFFIEEKTIVLNF